MPYWLPRLRADELFDHHVRHAHLLLRRKGAR